MKVNVGSRVACVVLALVLGATACTSAPSSVVSEPPVFGASTSVPSAAPTSPAVVEPTVQEGGSAVTDADRAAAAIAQLLAVDIKDETSSVLDAGVITKEIKVGADNLVTITACTWWSKSIRSNRHTYRYVVTDELEAVFVDVRTNGPACMNAAMLDSAGAFAKEANEHFMIYLGDEFDIEDPLLGKYWEDSLVDDLRERRRFLQEGFTSVRFFENWEDGEFVAWAHYESPVELVIAIRYDYDNRYGTYDTRTGDHLTYLSPQFVADDFLGNDHVFTIMLWWVDGIWKTFAIEDLWPINCDEPSCVATLTAIGPHPNRPVHQVVDFAGLTYHEVSEP